MPINGPGLIPRMNGKLRDQIEALFPNQITLYLPTSVEDCPVCGWDDFARSGFNPGCPTCHGIGKVFEWATATVSCRAVWVDPAKLHIHQGIVAGDIGDAQIQARLRDEYLFKMVLVTEWAYIAFDGKRLKPKSIALNKVEQPTSLDVRCYVVPDAIPGGNP